MKIINKNKSAAIILGGGITGLAAGIASELPVYEAQNVTGGICSSYYIQMDDQTNKHLFFPHGQCYRFESGGGHWIFGSDPATLHFMKSLTPVRSYQRNSAVYFPNIAQYVPYPLQNHLSYLPKNLAKQALNEITQNSNKTVSTLADWLELNFCKTLCKFFFFPFHQLYTAGLYTKISPQDLFKTPVDKNLIVKGAREKTPVIGYNATFIYPENGLDDLIRKMTEKCKVNYERKVTEINIKKKEILFEDGSGLRYENIISTLPLNQMVKISKTEIDEPWPPYNSVLVLNIGAKKGSRCPDYHWLYIPESKSGFHRIGFYSNVDISFLPAPLQKERTYVSIYVEKAYQGGIKPNNMEVKQVVQNTVQELKEWRFITEAKIIETSWIDVAYTWSWSGSTWRQRALELLESYNIYQAGRYGCWKFQGIMDSVADGLMVGNTFKRFN